MHTGIIMGLPTTLSMNLVCGIVCAKQVADITVGYGSWMGVLVTSFQVL
jgi:hypothetical protein